MAGAQLGHHVAAMDFHRSRADGQIARDLLVGASLAEQFQHLAFAPAQLPDRMARLDLAPAAAGERLRLAKDRSQPAREAAHLQRQGQIIERARLDHLHRAFDGRLVRREHHRQPYARGAQAIDQHPSRHREILVSRQDDPFIRRAFDQFAQIAIDFGMMAQREGDPRLFRPRPTIAPDDMKSRSFHIRHSAPSPPGCIARRFQSEAISGATPA